MAEQVVPNIGQLVTGGNGRRDAVHIAVAPVIAGQILLPGQHVALKDGKAVLSIDDCIGIVDPFLKERVPEGETFWLFLYPNTVTSLRHVWTHPAFKPTIGINHYGV